MGQANPFTLSSHFRVSPLPLSPHSLTSPFALCLSIFPFGGRVWRYNAHDITHEDQAMGQQETQETTATATPDSAETGAGQEMAAPAAKVADAGQQAAIVPAISAVGAGEQVQQDGDSYWMKTSPYPIRGDDVMRPIGAGKAGIGTAQSSAGTGTGLGMPTVNFPTES
jgi:hypothetical protein